MSKESTLKPLASGAQDGLVNLPGSIAANDGGVSEVAGLEKTNIGGGKTAVTIGSGHPELLIWQR